MNKAPSVNSNDALSAVGERSIEITKEKGVAIDVIEVWHPAVLPQLELRQREQWVHARIEISGLSIQN